MSGFIYLWYDRKHKRFYLGKHWGSEDDGYVCSSSWMKKAYKRRPEDFGERRILERVTTSKSDLSKAEKRWGSLIKESELGKRYYNLKLPGADGHWSDDPNSRLTVSQKISRTKKGRPLSKEQKAIFLENRCTGAPRSEECRAKISAIHKGKPKSDEHKKKIGKANRARSPKINEKISNTLTGKKKEPFPCPHCGKMIKNIGPHLKSRVGPTSCFSNSRWDEQG